MVTTGELRERAQRWRVAAQDTRAECEVLRHVSGLSWRSPSAQEFRQVISRRITELQALAEREDAVADLLVRVAESAELAA
ncbi:MULTISPECIES: hypothetical protein [unclassified Knoellia]|uniref:hypothetical protein n=1 Tax=Knoellia altitudinis TaxID=3404795 RepID=UPI00361ECEBA